MRGTFLLTVAALVCASFFSLSLPAAANGFVQSGHCALVIGSRKTISEVRRFIQKNQAARSGKVYRTQNGWYAITAGIVPRAQADRTLRQLKTRARIPHDSFCSTGAKFVSEINPQNRTSTQTARAVPPKPSNPRVRYFIASERGFVNMTDRSVPRRLIRKIPNGEEVWPLRNSGNLIGNLNVEIRDAHGNRGYVPGAFRTVVRSKTVDEYTVHKRTGLITSAVCRTEYQKFLREPRVKAFALGNGGKKCGWGSRKTGLARAYATAINNCPGKCALYSNYAVDPNIDARSARNLILLGIGAAVLGGIAANDAKDPGQDHRCYIPCRDRSGEADVQVVLPTKSISKLERDLSRRNDQICEAENRWRDRSRLVECFRVRK